jgi:hypothetical protein
MLNFKIILTLILLLAAFSAFTNAQTTKRDYSKKIEEATPKSLPQTPAARKLKSDAEDENLKRKVKTVIKEKARFSEQGKTDEREFSEIVDFNEKGDFIKRVIFSRGTPFLITVYGYIDGVRASNSNCIGCRRASSGSSRESKIEEKPKPDPRYEYKYEHKYIEGKLAEVQMFYNTGVKGMRYIYNYTKNQMEELAYTDEGELNQKYLTIFDDKGNEIKWTSFAVWQPDGSKDNTYVYEYKSFDKFGNWTERTFSEVKIENGKETIKLIAIEYQTIKYYP